MKRTLASETPELIEQTIQLSGWVNSRRDHGGLIFIDLRDHSGIVQLVINPDQQAAFTLAEAVRDEFVLSATGIVKERAAHLKNPNLATGGVEVEVTALQLLNKSEPLPVATKDEGAQSSEELRLKYRYLDLRRPRMQQILKRRAEYYQILRRFMDEHDFIEITTPILANSSPEGARDFLIPSRIHAGKFYALPQAPQQFKQLLMVGGVPRYYQLATCFRDEDPRADRLYGDFYQLDLEMSFVDDGEVVRTTTEPLIKDLVTNFAGKQLLSEQIPRLTYSEAIERFGSDKPDLRFGLELIDLSSQLQNSQFAVFANALESGGIVKALCVPGGARFSRKQIDQLTELAKQEGAGGLAYIKYQDNQAVSPIAKFLTSDELAQIQAQTGASEGDLVLFAADNRQLVNKVLGVLRHRLGDILNLKDPNKVALAWIVDFPFYEWDEASQKVDFGHNPFSLPKGGLAALENAKTDQQKLDLVADQYDMVMNGYEVCSGAVRNYNPDVMYRVFALLGYDRQYVEDKFGAMLTAFKFGAPPHAGCAYGIDRIFMILMDETNIRNTVAFPKNGSGIDLMMNSPSSIEDAQLNELSINIKPS